MKAVPRQAFLLLVTFIIGLVGWIRQEVGCKALVKQAAPPDEAKATCEEVTSGGSVLPYLLLLFAQRENDHRIRLLRSHEKGNGAIRPDHPARSSCAGQSLYDSLKRQSRLLSSE